MNEVDVAVKELKGLLEAEYNTQSAWELEVKTLTQTNLFNHQHLVRCLAAFRRGEKHYIMFEWADRGSLRELWAENPTGSQGLNGSRVVEFLEQLHGLADGLCKLHNTREELGFNTSTDSLRLDREALGGSNAGVGPGLLVSENRDAGTGGPSTTEHWRHGDLKPENILVFEGSSWLGTLKIADLGLAKQHKDTTSLRVKPTEAMYATMHYEAPEVVSRANLPRSRRYDIWSMGCIIFESIIWLLYGSEVLVKFYGEKKHINNAWRETLYFTVSDQGNVKVSEIVSSWMDQMLKEDPECNKPSALGDLLRLVRDRLLVGVLKGPRGRAYASRLHEELGNIIANANKESSYLFTGTSRAGVKSPKPFRPARDFLSTSMATGRSDMPSAMRPTPLVSFLNPLFLLKSPESTNWNMLFLECRRTLKKCAWNDY
jgi:serine/threonine protein kinase